MNVAEERYIGDGVYASFDGYQIWVRAEDASGTNRIALEPEVFAHLVKYEADLRAHFAVSQ